MAIFLEYKKMAYLKGHNFYNTVAISRFISKKGMMQLRLGHRGFRVERLCVELA